MTDDERRVVLEMNDWLRNKLAWNSPLYQKLRRCCACMQSACADRSACRAEFSAWAERKWDTAVAEECAARGKEMRRGNCD